MKISSLLFYFFLLITIALSPSCKKKYGCMDAAALNYDPEAEYDDGSCHPDLRLTEIGTYFCRDSIFDAATDTLIHDLSYNMEVTIDPSNISQVIMTHFKQSADDYYATVTNSGTFAFDYVTVTDSLHVTGKFSADRLYMAYDTDTSYARILGVKQ